MCWHVGRRCEAGPAAPKPMAPGNGATFLWRHAFDRRFGDAVDSTMDDTRRCRHPTPASLLRSLPYPKNTMAPIAKREFHLALKARPPVDLLGRMPVPQALGARPRRVRGAQRRSEGLCGSTWLVGAQQYGNETTKMACLPFSGSDLSRPRVPL